ncbi:type III secretion system cytoplasmic ring protein SctQ [Burkholderia pyrrocinia]|uniref:type III secretion system cytoplasmic ring protein SctQ n=1 Tax=Burkholderia pyrrocinia TaxID=60550 RepID=UPI001589266A|nr:type III secretion system cytoplasmic ring protein SctQ [Burkholderia pyrrocinia]
MIPTNTNPRSRIARVLSNPDGAPIPTAPPRLPDVAQCAARITRLVFDARWPALVDRVPGLTECHASISDDNSSACSTAPFPDRGLITLVRRTETLSIDIDLAAYPALSVVAPPIDSACNNDRTLRDALACALLAPLTVALEQAGSAGWQVARLARTHTGTHPAGHDAVSFVSLSFQLNGERHRARVGLDSAATHEVARLLNTMTPARAFPFPSIPVAGRLGIGAKPLRTSVLRSLAPGDVLLGAIEPALATPGTSFSTIAVWGTPRLMQMLAPVKSDGRTVTLLEDPFMTQDPSPSSHDAPDRADPVDVGALEVPVNLEIDTIALSIDQLAALRAGYIMELPRPAAEMPIRLVACGQLIGRGELVTVGEQLGVRILDMAQRDDSRR